MLVLRFQSPSAMLLGPFAFSDFLCGVPNVIPVKSARNIPAPCPSRFDGRWTKYCMIINTTEVLTSNINLFRGPEHVYRVICVLPIVATIATKIIPQCVHLTDKKEDVFRDEFSSGCLWSLDVHSTCFRYRKQNEYLEWSALVIQRS